MGEKGVVGTLVQAFLETGRSLKRQPVCQAPRSEPLQSMGKRGREDVGQKQPDGSHDRIHNPSSRWGLGS